MTPLPAQAVVVFIKVPWDQTNEKHTLRLELLDGDGKAVAVPGPVGDQPLKLEGDFEAGRPPGIERGTAMDMALAFQLPPGLPLPSGRYEWILSIDEESQDGWRASFGVRAPQQTGN